MYLRLAGAIVALIGISGFLGSAAADDCGPVRAAMTATAQTPSTVTVRKTNPKGTTTVSQVIQTATTKYVQTKGGKWYAMNISFRDLLDTVKASKLTCQHTGSEVVIGAPAGVYNVHIESDGNTTDGRMWISAKGLIVKGEVHFEGIISVSTYDYGTIKLPTNAISMGGR